MLEALTCGELRAATCNDQGEWLVNPDVKMAILTAFREGKLVEYNGYVDKHTILPREFNLQDKVRLVPGGSAVRAGAYVAPGVVIMPPSFVNVGAYIDEGSMIDSHVLVGSCAQVGKRVHLSMGVGIGGVLEPIGAVPVIIEDDCFIGANVQIMDGRVVRTGAVLAAGVVLSRGVPVFDLVNETQLSEGAEIPAGAVVVPGSRPASTAWARAQGLQNNAALIVKYRDPQTDAAVALENVLRDKDA